MHRTSDLPGLGRIFILPAALLFSGLLCAAEADPLFQDDDILDITLTGPFSRIDRERDKELEYEGATLRYMDGDREVVLEAKLVVRGNFRLQRNVCRHAQLWVDLDKDKVDGTLFAGQNRIKLVVQCRESDRYRGYIAREHQAYQLYSTVTDISYRSRLLNVTFQDNEKDDSRTTLGIFIEHKDRLAERIGMGEVDLQEVPLAALDAQQANLVNLFMFMIGNTDFSLLRANEDECCHNAKLFEAADGTYFPAPYDFDSSGYVDASYAQPNAALKLRNNRQRLYRGFCVPDGILNNSVAAFDASAQQMLAIAGDTSLADEKEVRDAVDYLEAFFAIVNDPDELQDEIIDDCRG